MRIIKLIFSENRDLEPQYFVQANFNSQSWPFNTQKLKITQFYAQGHNFTFLVNKVRCKCRFSETKHKLRILIINKPLFMVNFGF